MAFVQKHYVTSFINFDPIYKYDLYTKFDRKKHIFAKKQNYHGLLSWIKVYKLHKKKNLGKCHIWISFRNFDPTPKFRKTWLLYLTFVIWPPEYKAILMCSYMAFCKMFYVVLLKLTYNMFAAVKLTVFRLLMMKKAIKYL